MNMRRCATLVGALILGIPACGGSTFTSASGNGGSEGGADSGDDATSGDAVSSDSNGSVEAATVPAGGCVSQTDCAKCCRDTNPKGALEYLDIAWTCACAQTPPPCALECAPATCPGPRGESPSCDVCLHSLGSGQCSHDEDLACKGVPTCAAYMACIGGC